MATKKVTAAKKTAPVQKTGSITKKKLAAKKTATKKATQTTGGETAPVKKNAPLKAAKESAAPKAPVKKTAKKKKTGTLQKIIFQLRFRTQFGQQLFITGDHILLGNNNAAAAVPLQYFNEEFWSLVVEIDEAITMPIHYHYILRNPDGIEDHDFGNDKFINPAQLHTKELLVIDTWNHTGFVENTFYTKPFTDVLLPANKVVVPATHTAQSTHTWKIKAPLLTPHQTVCLVGSCNALSQWDTTQPVLMQREAQGPFFSVSIDLSDESFPIAYKYGVYDTVQQGFVCYESCDNRVLFDTVSPNRQVILHDGFAALPDAMWKGTGIAVPVFSLRTERGWGTGEFSDLKTLVDWIKPLGIKMIQVLPVNDTTASGSWRDSYPYSAISAFALHPLYMNLERIATPALQVRIDELEEERKRLNALPAIDYEAVTRIKNECIAIAYRESGARVFRTKAYKDYLTQNSYWLVPYAAFCYLRDTHGTVEFDRWPEYSVYDATSIAALAAAHAGELGLYYFTQFQLHLQLQEATAYARENGVIVKGDIPIGVSRNSADAWQEPALYNMHLQAGAPPDDFAVKGQNWSFPTYNWQRMVQDGFAWWKQRFTQMDAYFDAFRVDHILGFFRIWSIPQDAVEGILGHFVPAIPVHISEFNSKGISFDHARYTKPFINEEIIKEMFGTEAELVKSMFLDHDENDRYILKPAFATQRQVEQHFATLENDDQHAKIRSGLYDLISNVLLFTAEDEQEQSYHFRFNMEHTASFRYLDEHLQRQLKELYVNYFFRRQDVLWRKEALQKLPELKRVTNMLVCGEDLGLIPACVPDVMKQAGLLSLEIQRMPKDSSQEFFHPNRAPYLSVVTPATHDMSTIRGWWEEDPARTQRFFHHELGQEGEAPQHAEPWICKAIILQHLYSPAMWAVFQLQDLLGMDETLRRKEVQAERINIPADPAHYWQYRVHVPLETLKEAVDFNTQLQRFIFASGR